MRAVFKYVLNYSWEGTILELPINSKILHAREQGEDVCIWVELDQYEEKKEKHEFKLFTTGQEIPGGLAISEKYEYIGTASLQHGNFIIHIYKIIRENQK